MKTRRFISLLLTVAFLIATVRFIAIKGRNQTSGQEINIKTILQQVRDQGNIFEYNEFWTSTQIIKYSFESLTNALKANNGEDWTGYTCHENVEPGHGYTTIAIRDTSGEIVGWIVPSTEHKPASNEGVIEWITYIGRFMTYIGKMFVSLGRTLLELFKTIINSIYKTGVLIYYLCFWTPGMPNPGGQYSGTEDTTELEPIAQGDFPDPDPGTGNL